MSQNDLNTMVRLERPLFAVLLIKLLHLPPFLRKFVSSNSPSHDSSYFGDTSDFYLQELRFPFVHENLTTFK